MGTKAEDDNADMARMRQERAESFAGMYPACMGQRIPRCPKRGLLKLAENSK